MKYDDASWHYGGQFPEELPPEAGATHIGMFVAWAMLQGLGSEEHERESGDLINALRGRKMTPGEWFIQTCDEKFIDADLNEEGNIFALEYYGEPNGKELPPYLKDYSDTFDGVDQLYYVTDSWANYDRLAPLITKRFSRWQQARSGTSLWKRIFK
jgi:hypothetical protein